MVEARVTWGLLPRAWTLATTAALGLSSVGCTMCPDPFDYSGPVPNGSTPQNDFRARSNGILPLGAASKPWPPIVEDDGGGAAAPGEHEADADQVVQRAVAVVGETTDDADAADESAAMQEADGTQPTLEAVPFIADPTLPGEDDGQAAVVEQPLGEPSDGQPPVAPLPVIEEKPSIPRAPALPPMHVGETPGWRSRRR